MIALDEDTGEVAWVRVLDDYVYSSAAVAERTVIVGSYDQQLTPSTPSRGGRAGPSARVSASPGSPSVIGDVVYASTLAREPRDGRTVALDLRTGERLWTFPDGRYSPAVAVTACSS